MKSDGANGKRFQSMKGNRNASGKGTSCPHCTTKYSSHSSDENFAKMAQHIATKHPSFK